MKSCDNKYQSILNFDDLSDEEFEDVLAHAGSCRIHARLLDSYNDCLTPLITEKTEESVLPVSPARITVGGVWGNLLWLKVRKAFGSFSGYQERDWVFGAGFLVMATILLFGINILLAGIFRNSAGLPGFQSILIAAILSVGFIFAVSLKLRGTKFAMSEGRIMPVFLSQQYKETKLIPSPERHQPPNITLEEKAVSSELKKITETGFNAENCQKALEFLKKNEDVLKNSWMNTLNKARLLIGTGQRDEPRKIIGAVMEDYSYSRQAIGSAYKVLAWLEEIEYNEGGKTDPNGLDRRMNFIRKGLQFYPEYYLLWMDAFEVSCQRKNSDDAFFYLAELMKMDKEIAEKYLMESPFKQEIKMLGLGMKMKVAKVTLGRKIMKQIKSDKVRNSISVVIIALSLLPFFRGEMTGAHIREAFYRADVDGLQNTIAKKAVDGLQLRSARSAVDGLQK